jgi:hypothetical protein
MTASTDAARAPDFYIVGQPKSGTTALYEALRSHPQIFMPELKEPVYFATELPRQAHRYTAPATLAEYLGLFSPALPGQLTGEASASYLWSKAAAAGIAQVRPDALIVAILREPASFLRSFHLQMVQSQNESEKDLARALALEDARREGREIPRRSSWPQLLLYSEQVRYVEQLRRYHEAFGAEQVLTLIYDDFRADNEGTVRRVLEFLGVDASSPVDLTEVNPSVRMRSQRLDEVVNSISVGRGPLSRAVKGLVKTTLPQRLRRSALRSAQRRFVVAEPTTPDERLMLDLRRRYRDEVVALGEYLGRDLVRLWGYDDVS